MLRSGIQPARACGVRPLPKRLGDVRPRRGRRMATSAALPNPVAGDVAVLGIGRAVSSLWNDLVANPKPERERRRQPEKSAREAQEAASEAAAYADEAEQDALIAVQAASHNQLDEAAQASHAAQHAADKATAAAAHAEYAASTAIASASRSGGANGDADLEAVAAAVAAAEAAEEAAEDAIDVAGAAEAVYEVTRDELAAEEYVDKRVHRISDRVDQARTFLTTSTAGKGLLAGVALVLAGTLASAAYTVYQRQNTDSAKRRRTVDKNRALVDALNELLPHRRGDLTAAVVQKVVSSTGFTPTEVFRKYLWYLLRERPFDQDAVSDLVALKAAAGLDDAAVAEALRERSQRIYDKYGTLMLNTEGMTPAGIERKATCRALYGKLLYLTECQQLLDQGGEAFAAADLRQIFGATDEDCDNLRIPVLGDTLDVERLERLVGGTPAPGGSEQWPSSSTSSDEERGGGSGGGGGAAASSGPPKQW